MKTNPFDQNTLPVSLSDEGERQAAGFYTIPSMARVFGLMLALLAAAFRTFKVIAAESTITRPGDTTAYASGDLVANSTTAGSVTPFELKLARISGSIGRILRVRLQKSGTSITNAAFRVHFFTAAPTVTNGDNGALVPSLGSSGYIGSADVTVGLAGSDGAVGLGLPNVGTAMVFDAPVNSRSIYALLEARGAYTPDNAEVFTLSAEIEQS